MNDTVIIFGIIIFFLIIYIFFLKAKIKELQEGLFITLNMEEYLNTSSDFDFKKRTMDIVK